jgi:GNAT superfamily N-acetyltransferase
MAISWTDNLAAIDWSELSALYRAAPLGDKAPADLELVFGNSMFRVFAFDDGCLVGAGRALADGRDCSYLCDIAVLPSHSGRGLGKQIVERLVRLSAGHRKIILYSVPGREPFYAAVGFRRMTTAMAIFENQADARARGYLHDVEPPAD